MKLGYGTWGLGGIEYGPLSYNKAISLLEYSYHKKIIFFDTAPLYGFGRVEKIIGDFLIKKNRKKIIICSKCGMLPHNSFKMKQNFSKKKIFNDLSNSLSKLKTDYLDILLLHSPNLEDIDITDAILTLKILKKKKLVKKIGISLRSPNDIVNLKKFYNDIDYLEFNFNLLDQRALSINIFNISKKNKIKLICRTPLGFGFLSSKKIKKDELSPKDHRKKWSKKQFERWIKLKRKFYFYKKKYNCKNLSSLALSFCGSFDFDYVIPGMLSKHEINQNSISIKKKISKKDLKDIFKIYSEIEKNIFIQKRTR